MLQVGDIFLSQSDIQRINLQQFHEDLYLSQHVYDKTVKRVNPDTGSIQKVQVSQLLPLPQTISETWSDLLFMEFPQLTFEDETADSLVKQLTDSMQIDLLEAEATNSAIGMLWWVLFRVDGKAHWKFIQPQFTKWTKNELGELINFKMFHELPMQDPSDAKRMYKVIEHTYAVDEETDEILITDNGTKIHVINEFILICSKDKDDEWKVVERRDINAETTDLSFIPVIEVQNQARLGTSIGRSDYEGKEDLFKEIDNRYAQLNYVINENADPWILMPPGVLNENGFFNRSNGKMIEKAPTGTAENNVELVTWDGQLSAAFEAVKSMMKQLLFTCRLSPAIMGLEVESGGTSESGRSLKWRSVNTLIALGKKRLYWNDAFRKFFQMLSDMDVTYAALKDKELKINWQDGLPIDITERTQVIVQQVNAGLKSKETAIRELNEIGQEAALEEIEKINQDQTTQAEIESVSLPSIQV